MPKSKNDKMGMKNDTEGYMSSVELDTIEANLAILRAKIKNKNQQLPAWIQSKITRAADFTTDAAQYLNTGEELEESSFKINPEKHSRPAAGTNAKSKIPTSKLTKDITDKVKAPVLPKFSTESTIVDRILKSLNEEEDCSCTENKKKSQEPEKGYVKGSKPVLSVEDIASKHGVSPARIQKQLKMGVKVEGEHTTNKEEAEGIALQHLAEKPNYYTELKKVEKIQSESTIVTDLFGNPKFEFIDLGVPSSLKEAKKQQKGGTLHHWFNGSKSKDGKPGWVQSDGSPCANEKGETSTPKCFSSGRLKSLERKGETGESLIKSAVRRKREQDPGQQNKSGGVKPTNVSTFAKGKKNKNYVEAEPSLKESNELSEANRDKPGKGSGTKDACYHKVKSRYRVFPSAYSSGALVKCRKVGASNWGNSKIDEATLPVQNGQVMQILFSWRGKMMSSQLFFPQVRIPNRKEVTDAIVKVYPDAKVLSYRVGNQNVGQPIIQLPNTKSKNFLLQNKTIGESYVIEEGFLDNIRKKVREKRIKRGILRRKQRNAENDATKRFQITFASSPQSKSKTPGDITPYLSPTDKKMVAHDDKAARKFDLRKRNSIQEEGPSLSVGRGEKLSVEAGGGLTAKGRERYNRATGSNLKAPVTGKVKKGSKAWKRRRNFCSRSRSWNKPRGLAARRRWKC
jgi:Domain of unknown function (DUF6321)/Protein of unknown function (DUF5661)